ncbi:MAG: hypothetical protein C5B52_01270 [Bacteroidetes bacterium]|nr:MAG: hypothetical protein C5B52_01270 [Bacteroidota bacterium]
MKKVIFLLGSLALFISVMGQKTDSSAAAAPKEKKPEKKLIGLGLKAGVNFSNVTNASEVNANNTTGFMIGAFYAPQTKGVLGFRTEIIYSKQGYDYANGSSSGSVKLDYLLLPQLTTINISRFFEIDFGIQLAFLLNAKADSSKASSGSNPYGAMLDYYNKFQYGLAGGIQINPIRRLFIGARYGISLSNMYKDPSSYSGGGSSMPVPPFIPSTSSIDLKNNVLTIFAGLKF